MHNLKRLLCLLSLLIACPAFGTDLRSAGIKGATTSTPCAGCIGERVNFSETIVTVSAGSAWMANSTPIGTLSAGIWLIYPYTKLGTVNQMYAITISTSSTGGSGQIGEGAQLLGTTTASVTASLPAVYYVATGSTPIYAQGYCFASASTVNVGGFAIRIY